MQIFTTLVIILSSQLLAYADPISERNQKTRDNLYDRMSANFFVALFEIKNSDLPKKEQEKLTHLGANSAFQYWMTTRKGGVRISNNVDRAIAFFYEDALKSKMTAGFSDPLYRLGTEETDNIGVPGFSKMTQIQYKEYVGEFQTFLNEVLKKRLARQDDVKKRMEALEKEAQQE